MMYHSRHISNIIFYFTLYNFIMVGGTKKERRNAGTPITLYPFTIYFKII